jgi:hypothetical protein
MDAFLADLAGRAIVGARDGEAIRYWLWFGRSQLGTVASRSARARFRRRRGSTSTDRSRFVMRRAGTGCTSDQQKRHRRLVGWVGRLMKTSIRGKRVFTTDSTDSTDGKASE